MKPFHPFVLATTTLFAGACTNIDDVGQTESIEIVDPQGATQRVTITNVEKGPTARFGDVRLDGREFSLAQWIDSGGSHNSVTSSDGEIRYESTTNASGSRVVLEDAIGSRVVKSGDSLGRIDQAAATLFMNLHSSADAGATAYKALSLCWGYDTSDPDDWHLVGGWCICDNVFGGHCSFI